MKHCKLAFFPLVAALFLMLPVNAALSMGNAVDVTLVTAEGIGSSVGTIDIADVQGGVELKISLKGLPPGKHGFHIHEKGDCGPMGSDGKTGPALAAGGHYDPHKTGRHLGPDKDGHAGDLPLLTVKDDGSVNETIMIKGLTRSELKNRAIMIHAGGDNYSDSPEALGGGGARIACGVIK